MAFVCRCLLVIGLLVAPLRLTAAPPPAETRAFAAARKSFEGGFYDRAERELGEFTRQFPNSALFPEATLLQAQARLQRTNYAGGIELLLAGQSRAGNFGDQYLFCLGQAYTRLGKLQAAADALEQLTRQFPASPLRIEAAIGEANARARIQDWARVLALLNGGTNSMFQSFARENPTNQLTFRGQLLLSEAQLAGGNLAASRAALEALPKTNLAFELAWQAQYLQCRILLAETNLPAALAASSNLLSIATNLPAPVYQADSAAFEADLLERSGRPAQAIEAYRLNLRPGVSAERQRQALLKITALSLAANNLAPAAETLETFLTRYPKAEVADLALLRLGEIRREQSGRAGQGNASSGTAENPGATNLLDHAIAALNTLLTNFPQSSLLGKAQLDLGWCYLLRQNSTAAENAFNQAAERLPEGADRASALFKLADVQFARQDYTNAYRNYFSLASKYRSSSAVKPELIAQSLYQGVISAVMSARGDHDLGRITNCLIPLIRDYATNDCTARALLAASDELGRRGQADAARSGITEFLASRPDAGMAPELRLALARTYEQEENWTNAISQYDSWLGVYTNHPETPRAEFFRAQCHFQAYGDSNALSYYTNFLARFPTNEFTPLAQMWVADFHFRSRDYPTAEIYYRSLFKTWPGTELSYQAQMMAGRAAMARQGWADAAECFKALHSVPPENTNCPADLRAQALYAYGDYCLSRGNTNKLADYKEAISAFEGVIRLYPTNRLAPLAWGEMAMCYWQWAQNAHDADSITNALNGFQQVTNSPLAGVKARSIAKVGLGLVLEQIASQKPGAEQATAAASLRKQALDHYLDVFYGTSALLRDGDNKDLFWAKEAGLQAARLAEEMHEWESARKVCEQLLEAFPFMRSRLENKIISFREQEQAAQQ
jgi:TolA-binding protein